MAASNWLRSALFTHCGSFHPASLTTGHWPLFGAAIPRHSPCQITPTPRAAFRLGRRAGLLIRANCQRHSAPSPSMEYRTELHECCVGLWDFLPLDGTSVGAMGSR